METITIVCVGLGAAAGVAGVAVWLRNRKPREEAHRDEEVITVQRVDYAMLMDWLRHLRKQGVLEAGDKLKVMQHPAAANIYKEAYPKQPWQGKVLAAVLVRKGEPVAARFYRYETMTEALADTLPKDSTKAFVLNIEE